MKVPIAVRSGEGTVTDDGSFDDTIKFADLTPVQHLGWQSVRYKGKRYQLRGGVSTDYFICLNNPIARRKSG